MKKKQAVNAVELKQRNQAAILRLLSSRPISRADLARELGLTRASAGDHIDLLLAEGKVRELGEGQAGRGRKPVLLDINPGYACFAGVYLSRGICRFGLVDLKGCVIAEDGLDNAPKMDPATVLDAAGQGILSMLEKRGLPLQKLISVGVSAPGPVDTVNGVILTPPGFVHWHGIPAAERLGGILNKPVFIENNAASQTMAELRFGHGRRYDSFLMLIVDSGIGGGIVIDGRRVAGEKGFGAEFGHTSIAMDGRLCSCGNRGCLERYAAISELIRDCFAPDEDMTSWRQIVDGAYNAHARCVEAVELEAHYLATAIVSFVNMLEPQAVVLGGDLRYKPGLLTGLLANALQTRAMMRGVLRVEVLPSALERNHYVLSAVASTIDRFYSD